MTSIPSPEVLAQPEKGERPSNFVILMRTRPELILAPGLLVVILGAWEWSVRFFGVPTYILPAPSQVLVALWRGINTGPFDRGGYWLHAGVTLYQLLIGLVLGAGLGLLLGTIISQVKVLEATLRIYLVAIQSLPKIALAPLIVLWFGFGVSSKIVIICMLTFFPLLVTSMAGFQAIDSERIELMQSLGANAWQTFWKARLPSALPYIFAGLDMAAVFAVVGAIVGEFVGAQRGLGTLILSMNAQMDTAGTFSVFIILSLIGIILHQGLRLIEKRVLFWSGEHFRALSN